MSLVVALLFFQTAAATPTPTAAPTPTPRSTTTSAGAAAYGGTRTLSDVARERKLKAASGEKSPKKGSVSVASGSGGAGASASPTPTGTVTPRTERVPPTVVVDSVQHNRSVDANGQVRVEGSVRNVGNVPACDVAVAVRLYDSHGNYLVSAVAKADEPILQPGKSSSFAIWVQAPPGVVGSFSPKAPGSGPVSGSVSLEGNWRTLGRPEAEIESVGESCPGEKPES